MTEPKPKFKKLDTAKLYLDGRNRISEQLHSNMLLVIIWRALVNLFSDKKKPK